MGKTCGTESYSYFYNMGHPKRKLCKNFFRRADHHNKESISEKFEQNETKILCRFLNKSIGYAMKVIHPNCLRVPKKGAEIFGADLKHSMSN